MAYRIGIELDMREKRQMNGGDHEWIMIHFRRRRVRYIRLQARSISNAGGCKHRERRRLATATGRRSGGDEWGSRKM